MENKIDLLKDLMIFNLIIVSFVVPMLVINIIFLRSIIISIFAWSFITLQLIATIKSMTSSRI